MNSRRPRHRDTTSWLPAAAAALVLALVVGIGVFLGGNGTNVDADADDPTTATAGPTTDPTPAPAVDASVVATVSPEAPVAPLATPLAAPLSLGSAGDDVRRVQERLAELGFQPGPADGQFGSGTQQAVWAFKKLVDTVEWEVFATRDDQTAVTDEVWQQMADPSVRFLPRRPGAGTHVEIYLPQQVMAVFRDDVAIFISHISSGELRPDGEPATFCETATYDTDENGNTYPEPLTKQVCAEAKSPGGVFSFRRYHDGNRVSPLGGMKNPWYFNYGIAIHGAKNVPTAPASHGCIRISNSLADVFPDLVERGDRVYVWGHDGKEPEQYSERASLPSFNRPDPNATTTTTTTTSTTTSTTTAPTTTAPPSTVAATTTAAPTTPAPTAAPITASSTAPSTTTTTAAAP